MRYHFWVIGCQMNVADAERIARCLGDQGHQMTQREEEADIVILSSCSVRQAAEDKLFGKLHQVAERKKREPDLVVAVTGCVTDGDVHGFLRRAPMVDLYLNPRRPESLLELIAERGLAEAPDYGDLDPKRLMPNNGFSTHLTSAISRYIPAIYGCNYHCTYCIVPFTRGPQASRRPEEIVSEARWLLAEGAKELVLLGQTVDAYGEDLDPPVRLSDLLDLLHDLPGLERLRFLTSHPNHMTQDLIEAVADQPKVCEHINLPFQAGDDLVLKRMARRYKAQRYKELISRIRERVPNVSLSTDVIVGFCGETDEQFERTVDMVRDVRFDVVHVAMYSPRKGTPSERVWPDDVPREVKKRRLRAIEQLQAQIAAEINQMLLGTVQEVLVEGPSEHGAANGVRRWGGRTRSNKLVFFDSAEEPTGRLVEVRIDRTSPWFLEGGLLTAVRPARRRELIPLAAVG